MSADRVEHLWYTNGLNLFSLGCTFNENLLMQIVVVVSDVLLSFSEQHHDVYTLVQLSTWQVGSDDFKSKFNIDQFTNVLIGLEIMGTESRHFVEDVTQILLYFVVHVNLLFKKIKVIHTRVSLDIIWSRHCWIDLFHIWNENAMNLHPEVFLYLLTDRPNHAFRKGLIDVFFVVVYSNMWAAKVSDVHQHLNRITYSHQQVVHLVKSMNVFKNETEEVGVDLTIPVEEATTCSLADLDFPSANVLKDFVQNNELLHF